MDSVTPAIRRYTPISTHYDMTDTMAIVTNWNEITYFSVFTIAVHMVYHQNSFIWIAAIIALFLVSFPSVLSVRTWFLRANRIPVPLSNLTPSTAKNSPCTVGFDPRRDNLKSIRALDTHPLNSTSSRSEGTLSRAKPLWLAMILFINKFEIAKLAEVINRFLSPKNASAFVTAGQVPIPMRVWNRILYRTYRTGFINFFHKRIVA